MSAAATSQPTAGKEGVLLESQALSLTLRRASDRFGGDRLGRGLLLLTRKSSIWALAVSVLVLLGCAVRRTTKTATCAVPASAREASLVELVAAINAQSEAIRSINAQVDLEPTVGSVYSGVIKQYHDVRSFILAKRPGMIRMVGQAPVVRAKIFDMASNGEEFQLYLPSQQKFIVGKTTVRKAAKNALENLRPQHILEALLLPPVDSTTERAIREEDEDQEHGRRYYVVDVFENGGNGELKRKIWFDRSNLEVVRVRYFGPEGVYLEQVQYSDRKDFQGVHYPTAIQIRRPVEDYGLSLTVEKAVFNQSMATEQFELKAPDGAERVTVSTVSSGPKDRRREERKTGWQPSSSSGRRQPRLAGPDEGYEARGEVVRG